MSKIKSVAIVGATGNLGPHVLKALLSANFQVTVLTRSQKPGVYDPSAKFVEVDYSSLPSLTSALQGIDALISTLPVEATPLQTILIDAAIQAGVKRFIPSEYGSVTTNPKVKELPIYSEMWKVKEYLHEKAQAGQLTWTVLACGAFLDFLFGGPMFLDWGNHKVNLVDGGDNRVSSTSLANVGHAIAGILRNSEKTENRILRVSEVILTQNRLLKIVKKLQPGIKWEVTEVKASDFLKEGLDGLAKGDFSVAMKVVTGTALAGDVYGSAYDETDNELLGIKELTEGDLESLVAGKFS